MGTYYHLFPYNNQAQIIFLFLLLDKEYFNVYKHIPLILLSQEI